MIMLYQYNVQIFGEFRHKLRKHFLVFIAMPYALNMLAPYLDLLGILEVLSQILMGLQIIRIKRT